MPVFLHSATSPMTSLHNSSFLSCEGYLFKGWEIDEDDAEDITKVNDDVFIMPEHDVTIRATWTRQSIVKTI